MTLLVTKVAAGLSGFDCNGPITPTIAKVFADAGFRFAIRYVGRTDEAAHDLSRNEMQHIFDHGLGLMVVQHVESESSWTPTGMKGRLYGRHAAQAVANMGLPPQTPIWCDLEGVDVSVSEFDTIAYCNQWAEAVRGEGFDPGLYVGWHCGLRPNVLYNRLSFKRYWAAYNLNKDQYPSVRGVQMRQREATALEATLSDVIAFDGNIVRQDLLGDIPTMVIRE